MGSGDTVLQSCKVIRVKRDWVSEAQRGGIQPYWPLTSCVTLGISAPQFLHLSNGSANAHLLRLLGESNAITCMTHRTQLMLVVSWLFNLVIASAAFIVLPWGLLSNSCKSL